MQHQINIEYIIGAMIGKDHQQPGAAFRRGTRSSSMTSTSPVVWNPCVQSPRRPNDRLPTLILGDSFYREDRTALDVLDMALSIAKVSPRDYEEGQQQRQPSGKGKKAHSASNKSQQ